MDKIYKDTIMTIQDNFEMNEAEKKINQLKKSDKSYATALDFYSDFFERIEDRQLANKLDNAINGINSTETELYFREGFKSGVRFILECIK